MRLQELFLTQEDKVKKAEQKLKGLRRAIEDGDAPEIHNAGYTIQGPAWGDLEKMGFAKKQQEPVGGNYVRERWMYNGPGPIKLLTKYAKSTENGMERGTKERIMQPGDATDWVAVDYT